MPAKPKTPVYLYVPNIIGYIRIIFLILFVLCAFRFPVFALCCMIISAILDAVDGFAARKLQQISKLGTTLDFALDRASIAAIELVLALIYPSFWMFFAGLLMLDIFSHLCQLYYTVFSGTDSHKSQSIAKGKLLSLYYNSRSVLFSTCFSHDGFLLAWFGYHFTGAQAFLYLAVIFTPGFLFKIAIHGLQISNTFQHLLALDEAGQKSA